MSRAVSWIALAVAAVALILSLIGPSDSEKHSDVVQKSDFYEVRDRLDALEANLGDLVSRLEEASNSAGSGAPSVPIQLKAAAPGNDKKSQKQLESLNKEIASLRDQVRTLEDAARNAPSPVPDGHSEQFRGAVATAQQEIRRERMRKHMTRMEQGRLEAMEDFAQKQGLNSDQVEGLRQVITKETEFAQMISGLTEGSNGEVMTISERREKMEGHRETLRVELEQILSPDAAQRFQEDVLNGPGARMAPPPPARRQ